MSMILDEKYHKEPMGIELYLNGKDKIEFKTVRAGLRYAYRLLTDNPRSKKKNYYLHYTVPYTKIKGSVESGYYWIYRVRIDKGPKMIICTDDGYFFKMLKADGTIGKPIYWKLGHIRFV